MTQREKKIRNHYYNKHGKTLLNVKTNKNVS